jgi:biopolymer transport protein ExbD/biopolymer transport protein TolR
MAMDVGGNRGKVRSDINITPLVDVVLVLLIIFMVVTPMLQRGKHVELPKAVHAATSGKGTDPVFISVTKEGEIFWEQDKKPLTLDELQAHLREAAAQFKPVMVKADVETEYAKIRPVLDRASKAKLKGVALAAEEQKK